MRSSAPTTTRRTPRRRFVALTSVVLTVAGLTSAAIAAVPTNHTPVGKVETIREGLAGIYVKGWAYDPDTTAPAHLHISLDHKRLATVVAKLSRPDVAKQHPGHGTDLGFHLMGAVPAGKHTVCVNVVDYPSKAQVPLTCKTVNFQFDPIGVLTSLTQTPGHLTATGWALDPSDPTSVRNVKARVDGTPVVITKADQPFANLSKSHPRAGDDHGYTMTFAVPEGTHKICIRATNIGLGSGNNVACQTRTVNYSPTGKITSVTQAPGGMVIAGYATDPDTSAATSVTVILRKQHSPDQNLGTLQADGSGKPKPGHMFSGRLKFPGPKYVPGDRTVCVRAKNLGRYGKNAVVDCATHSFNWNPKAALNTIAQHSPGARVTGWAVDPDTTKPISVDLYGDGKKLTRVTADGGGANYDGHHYTATVPLTDGKHTVCAVAINTGYGSGNSARACMSVTLDFEPYGKFESVTRADGSNDVVATGWAIDPDSKTKPVPVQVSVDGGDPVTGKANLPRLDVAKSHPGTGTKHGFAVDVPADDGEHHVCVTAVNILGGSGTVKLGCMTINAVHPEPASAPQTVTAVAGYGGARVVWTAPDSDGGAPWTGYTISAAGGPSVTVGPNVNSATVVGLKPSTRYTFSVVANNVAGASAPGVSPAVTTEKEPPPQTSPAPISTSRYIRNISGGGSHDLATMRKEGAADAAANPSGHGYLVVLAVGGQDESRQGVILTAGIRYVSYSDMVKNLKAYVAGYATKQKPSAPLTIAIATNNDIDVSKSSGASFANHIIDPVKSFTARYPGITIAGSDDMEPGFRAGYRQTSAWLDGYLKATDAPFVFTGSADGCSWTMPNGRCNNGWTMRNLYHLAGGASPIRIINLPQIYNTTMAQQWRYISLTGVDNKLPRIDFGGALTEWTACKQAHSCGSLTGNNAWTQMWRQLRAEPKLRPSSLPYSTDLRIDS
jgi:hypothetical protein